ncbi:unnamed protein product [Staurois parvus]|uniref:Uncharacterized protein n=1 Tax=Staurois parvus TaxID=386267 RepID=A0ABN9GKN9_9NEOB|nr:unnamed protein product [Staurois parvus]
MDCACSLCLTDTVEHRSSYGSINDHMQSSKQDVTSDIIAYYICDHSQLGTSIQWMAS